MDSNRPKNDKTLEFEGSNFLRMRLVLATLSGKSIRITKIRSKSDSPGLNEHEASLIRLFDKITNGSKIVVSETGTTLFYQPGLLIGGKVEHQCSLERGIGYYLEPLMNLGLFCKQPLHIQLHGVTHNRIDPSPDMLKQSMCPVIKRFVLDDEGLEVKVLKRGAAPGGGGLVLFRCPIRKEIKAQQIVDQGKIKRIRGVAWATRVSPAVSNRCIEAAKSILLTYLPDVYIYSDHTTGSRSGKSPGFGLTLTCETTTGVALSAEIVSRQAGDASEGPTIPENLGLDAAKALLEEVYRGGCVDSTSQSLALLLSALTTKDVSKIVTGPFSNYTIHFLRHMQTFMQVVFKLDRLEPEDELHMGADKIVATCVGLGYVNLSKRTT